MKKVKLEPVTIYIPKMDWNSVPKMNVYHTLDVEEALIEKEGLLERFEAATNRIGRWVWFILAVLHFFAFVACLFTDGFGSQATQTQWILWVLCSVAYKTRLGCEDKK